MATADSPKSVPSRAEPVRRIFLPEEWEAFEQEKVFRGSALDKKDGFIHLSTSSQLEETGKLFFKSRDVVIAYVGVFQLCCKCGPLSSSFPMIRSRIFALTTMGPGC